MNRAAWAFVLMTMGLTAGAIVAPLLAAWTAGVNADNMKAACDARGGDIIEMGKDKVCVRNWRRGRDY